MFFLPCLDARPHNHAILPCHAAPSVARPCHPTVLFFLSFLPCLDARPHNHATLPCHIAPSVARPYPSGRPHLAAHPATRRSSPAARPGLSPGLFCPPSGRPLLAAHPAARRSCPAVRPGLSPGPSPVRPPLHLPSLCPLPYNRSPVHGSAFLTPRTPRSAAPPPHRSAALENTSPGGFDRLLPAELSPSARKTADLAGKNSFFHAEAVSLQPQRQWYLPQTAARSGCADDTCINVEHTLHPGSRYGGS